MPGTIHGDYNEQNVIVQQSAAAGKDCGDSLVYKVYGIIDFGDLIKSYYVYEIAITIMYMMLDSSVVDFLEVGGHVLAGYMKERSLNEAELDSMRMCIAARFAQSLAMGAYSFSLNPTNTYLLTTAKNGWPQLKRLWNTPKKELYDCWAKVMLDNYNVKLFDASN